MKKSNLLYLICLLVAQGVCSWAQNGYQIRGTMKGLAGQTLTLAHYFGPINILHKSSATADTAGLFIFKGDKALPQGLYMLLKPNKQRLTDFVIGQEQHFSFSSDTLHLIDKMRIEGSPDSELLYQYQQQLSGISGEIAILQAQLKFRQDGIGQAKMNTLRKQIGDNYQRFIKEHGKTLTGKIMAASGEITLPIPPKRPDGKPDSTWLFNYYRNHFWDNFDFSDERLVRTPTLQHKLDRFMKELTFPHPDSLIQAADSIIEKALKGGSKEIQAYCIWYLTNQAENPAIMGTEAVFVHLAEKYYIGGIMPITDSSTVQNIRTKVNTLKPLLVGQIMPALALTDTTGKPLTLAGIHAKYTLLFLYDPNCSHCREATPVLKDFYDKNKTALNLQVMAVAITGSPDDWKNYIRTFGVSHWLHGYDYTFRLDFRKQFDVINAPMLYVLDEHKKLLPVACLPNN
ncbi:MAG: thioredoxin-like domain-containing protein [Spirosomataceae bacterium]